MKKIRISQSNSKAGLNRNAKNIQEAKKIVNELINKDTVSITITQKEWDEEQPVTANGDKISDVNNHYH